ncbi:MAG: hemolysin family protein [Burkholderiales bacterium]|nr:hemolysin family protein [Burkholderiales bacterium]
MSSLFYTLIAFLLVLLNGMFVAAEFSMVKVRRTQINTIKQSKKIYDRILVKINAQLDAYLSACQLGITLTSLGLGWIGEPTAAYLLQPIIGLFHIKNEATIEAISFGAAFVFISFLHIVLGELIPKSLSIRYPLKTSTLTSIPLYVFYYITYPAIWVLNSCSNLILTLLTRGKVQQEHDHYSTQEIKFILSSSRSSGEITADEAEIMEHTLDFADLRITEVMRPIDELICFEESNELKEILPVILENKYTRYPIYKNSLANIIGMIHVKDIFVNNSKNNSHTINQMVRPILKITAKTTTLNVLKKFRTGSSHIALIYDAKKPIGFVTLDNLLHVLIGKIHDEFHHTKDDWIHNADGSINTDGECSIYSLEQALDVDIPDNEEGEADNIQQLLTNHLGHKPRNNEIIKIDSIIFHIAKVENGDITQLTAKKFME